MRQQARMSVAGYLSRDPELRKTQQGESVLGLSIPFTPRRKNRETGEWEKAGPTLWVSASLWGLAAETFAPKLAKGTMVRVEGEPALRPWESDGKSGVNLELKFSDVAIIPTPPPRDEGAQQQQVPAEPDAWATPGAWGDDTPF